MTDLHRPFQAGDQVALLAECEDGIDPARVGVVIDAHSVDAAGAPVAAVDFPWADKVVVVPHTSLVYVESDGELSLPPKLKAAAQRLSEQLGITVAIGHLGIVDNLLDTTEPAAGTEPHAFAGTDTKCTSCGVRRNHAVHAWTPPYRLRYLDDLDVGDRVFRETTTTWVEGTILDRRDGDGMVWLIIVDADGDQRGINGHRYTTIPVPL